MKSDQIARLFDSIGVRHPGDLDLLLFFVRHPRALLTNDQIAALLGYDVTQLGQSLEVLLAAKLVMRTQLPTRAAQMYVFAASGPDGWLPSLVELASTREGRLAMRDALKSRKDTQTPAAHE